MVPGGTESLSFSGPMNSETKGVLQVFYDYGGIARALGEDMGAFCSLVFFYRELGLGFRIQGCSAFFP